MPPSVPKVAICPDCGARKETTASVCWLCGVPGPAVPLAKPVLPRSKSHDDETASTLTTIAILVAMVAVSIGLWFESRGLGLSFIVLVTPGLVRMLIESIRGRMEGEPLTLGEKIEMLFRSTAVFAGVLISLSVASAIAFFIFCVFSLGRMSFH